MSRDLPSMFVNMYTMYRCIVSNERPNKSSLPAGESKQQSRPADDAEPVRRRLLAANRVRANEGTPGAGPRGDGRHQTQR